MMFLIKLNQRERDELFQALNAHRRDLIAHDIQGRAKTTRIVMEKFFHAEREAKVRP